MSLNPNPKPSFTNPNCDWLVAQFMNHALPALNAEIRLLNRWRNKVNAMLDETSLNATQREVLTAILDQLARRNIIYNGEEPGVIPRGEDDD